MSVRMRAAQAILLIALVLAAMLALVAPAVAAPSITGTVTRSVDGAPLSGIQVVAYRFNAFALTWDVWDWTYSASDGTYALPDLPDDTYHVQFFDEALLYREQWYDRQTLAANATGVAVAHPTVSGGIDGVLDANAEIAGRVTSTPSGAGVSAATVTVYQDMGGSWDPTATAVADSAGYYAVTGLGTGTFRVGAADSAPHAVGHVFNSGVATVTSAPDVLTTAGESVLVDLAVPELVTSDVQPTYLGIAHVNLAADTTALGWPGAGISYRVDAGSIVATTDPSAEAVVDTVGLHTIEFWATNGAEESAHKTVSFSIPSVAGSVLGPVGEPVVGASVTAYAFDGAAWTATATVLTDATGAYAFGPLGVATVRVGAYDPNYRYGHAFFDGAADVVSAGDVALSSGVVPANFALPELVQSDAVAAYDLSATIHITADTTPLGWPGASVFYVLDGGAPVSAPGAATVSVTTPGAHTLEFWARSAEGTASAHKTARFSVTAAPQPPVTVASVTGVTGGDRFSVAIAAALATHPNWAGVTDVIIASGEDRAAADPLAASGLSWAYGAAPILLTRSASVPAEVKTAIAQAAAVNGGVTIRVVGGTTSVPDARIAEIRAAVAKANGWSASQAAALVHSDRILRSGNRYDLASAIALRMNAARPGEFPHRALLANGADPARFFDALALAPVAAQTGSPILLVKATSVPAATSSALKSLGIVPASRYVAGGRASVSAGVLAGLGVPSGNRFSGPTKWATAVAVADGAIARGWLAGSSAGIAAKLPDAVAAGAMLGAKSAPMLLTAPGALPAETSAWLSAHKTGLSNVYTFGGPSTISASVTGQIQAALK